MTQFTLTGEPPDDLGLNLGLGRALVPDCLVELAIRMVDSAKVCAQIAVWRAEDRERKGKAAGGRPASLDDRVALVLLMLLALENSPLLVTRIAEIIANRLSERARAMLSINLTGPKGEDWYDRIWRSIHSLLDVLDPFPGPRNRLLDKGEWAGILAARDPVDSERKQERLDWLTNQLLEASLGMIPREIRRKWKGNICIDATPVAAFGKRGTNSKSDLVGIEPDAAWYVREGDHRDPGDGSGKKKSKYIWGWEATLAVVATNDPSAPDEFPYLVAAIGFGKPGHDVSEHGIKAFASIIERRYPAGYAVADRAYFPNSKPENLQLPLRSLGYDLVFDYRNDQLGISESHAGAIQVEGAWYCPAMPQALIDATADFRVKKSIDEATWKQRIGQRRSYLLRPKESSDNDGYIPMRCPASGPSATVACPLKKSVGNPSGRTRIPVKQSHLDRICINRSSVSFPPTAGAKYAQALHYGSPEWQAMYSTARNTIEGFNGYVKDANYEALDQPGRRRMRGFTAQYILSTMLVVSANIRKIRTFLANAVVSNNAGKLTRKRQPRRRDRLANYKPASASVSSGDPPTG